MDKHDKINVHISYIYIYVYINNQMYIIRYNSNPKHSTLCCSMSGKKKAINHITLHIHIYIQYIHIHIYDYTYVESIIHV